MVKHWPNGVLSRQAFPHTLDAYPVREVRLTRGCGPWALFAQIRQYIISPSGDNHEHHFLSPKRKVTMNTQRPTLLVIAWLGTLLLSRLPQIVLREFLAIDPSAWIIWLWIFVGAALVKVLPLLPAVLLFAVMNAFGEELAYRAVPLSQLWTVMGKGQAIWMTAVWFGLGHYYGGIPSGLAGAVFLTLIAVLFGKAMLETKGIAMPVFIHLWGDVLVFAGYAMAA